jgi:hypothetical protein
LTLPPYIPLSFQFKERGKNLERVVSPLSYWILFPYEGKTIIVGRPGKLVSLIEPQRMLLSMPIIKTVNLTKKYKELVGA